MPFVAPTGRIAAGGFLVPVVALLAVDRIAKLASIASWSADPVTIVPGVTLTFLLNPGIIFSLPIGGTLAVVVSMVVASVFLIWLFLALRRRAFATALPLGVLLLGAASNLADRFLYGGVVDYIALGPLPVFNIADVLVLGGALLLLTREVARR